MSQRLWIVGILLALIIGGTIIAHFVLPIATCMALWEKLNWFAWALIAFLIGNSPFLTAKKLFSGPGFRTVLQVLTKLTQDNAKSVRSDGPD